MDLTVALDICLLPCELVYGVRSPCVWDSELRDSFVKDGWLFCEAMGGGVQLILLTGQSLTLNSASASVSLFELFPPHP